MWVLKLFLWRSRHAVNLFRDKESDFSSLETILRLF